MLAGRVNTPNVPGVYNRSLEIMSCLKELYDYAVQAKNAEV